MKVVSTLPISPRLNPNLGFFTIPVVADILAQATGSRAIQAINVVGSKAGAMESLPAHASALNTLGVDTSLLWLDSDNLLSLYDALIEGVSSGWLTRERLDVWLCPCGKTELPEQAESLLYPEFSATTYSLDNGVPYCRLCHQAAKLQQCWRLLLRLSDSNLESKVEPLYAAQELAALRTQFGGRKLSVSRERETGLHFGFGESEFQLDPDLVWMLFPALAGTRFNCSVGTLLTGHKTLKHAFTAITASRLLLAKVPELIVSLPYVIFGTRQSAPTVTSLLEQYGTTILRCLLAFALGSRRKELTLRTDALYWIEHSLNVPSEVWEGVCAENSWQFAGELWQRFSQQSMNNLLAKLRGKQAHKLERLEKLVLRGIFAGRRPGPS